MIWKNASRALSLAAAGIGALGFSGWVFGVEALKRIYPGWVTMKANTGLCLILAGLAIALLREENAKDFGRRVAQACAVIIAGLGLYTFGEYMGWWEPWLDQALYSESVTEAGPTLPGRMNLFSTLNFMLLGLAVLLVDVRPRRGAWPAQICALAVIVNTSLVFLDYYYGLQIPFGLQIYVSIALHTVIAFLLLGAAILLVRPDRGMVAVFLADNVGGFIARRVLLAALFLPALIGWLATLGHRAGYYGHGVAIAVLSTSLTLIFTGLVWWAAKALAVADAARRKVVEDLRRSERQLTDFFDTAPMSMFWAGLDGRILRVNDAELALLGYGREEYLGRSVSDFHTDKAKSADFLARLTAGEILVEYPAQLRCKDGSLRDVLINSSPYRQDGEFVHARCFTRDITALKRAETARSHLAAIIESSADAILSKDLDGIVTSWNAGAQRLFGYTAAEMIGQPAIRIIPADRQSEEVEILSRLRAGENIEHYDTTRVAKDGREVQVSLSISPIRNEAGAIVGVSKIVRDITARKQVELELAQQREWFRVTLSSIGDAVIATDAQGVITFLNPVAEAMTAWASADAYGRPLPEVFPIIKESTQAAAESPVERVLRGDMVHGLATHILLVSRDGREIPIENSAAPIKDAQGDLVGVVMVFHDVTELRRDAEALEQAHAIAEEANRAKDDFLAVLSHELRTPLTPALMAVSDLESSPPADPKALREALALIRRNIELEARLVDDLLDLTRINHGKLSIASAPVDLHDLLRDALTRAGPILRENNIAVASELAADPHHIRGDAVRLAQVFGNLLTNAAKFTPQAGRVTVRTTSNANRLRVEISDTGIGIAPEILPNIFEPFHQGETSTAQRFGGLGLGLSVAKSLVEAHGGTIEAHSDGRDRGSTFVVTLPAIEATDLRAADDAASGSSTPARRLRVLLVEDHEDTRSVLLRLITRWGHAVTSAGGVREARERLAENHFDLLLTDLGLPDGSGLDVIAALREKSDIPAVAMTGYGMNADLERTRAAGFAEHIVKPITADALRKIINRFSAPPAPADSGAVPA